MIQANGMFNKSTQFFLILVSIAFLSCSRQKDTLPAKVYHTYTSYFNWYYNANLLFNESVGKLENQYKFPERGFIDVIYFGNEQEADGLKTSMTDIIKKNDAVLFKHPNGNFIDDCRLLNGKCWFYQREYSSALQNFNYILDKFPSSPLAADAWLYMAYTYYQTDNRIMATNIIEENLVGNDTLEIRDETFGELGLFRTKLLIEQEEYGKATEILLKSLDFVKGDDRLTKANFLLGQLMAQEKKFSEAQYKFEEVAKMSKNYDLTFQAKLAIARLFVEMEKSDVGRGEDVFRYLTKLLKDPKNEEYQDQIYYEFALISLARNKKREAVDYLKKSLAVSVNNQRQKAISYYKIGLINFYDFNDYPVAQAYYDSAAQFIRVEDPEHDDIKRLAKTLGEYIELLTTIEYQDSMLTLAELPKEDLDKIIDKLVEEEKRRKEEEAAALLSDAESDFTQDDPFFANQNQGRSNRNRSGKWYFDDPGQVSMGKQEFEARWGRRRNEDNWRRSNKTTSSFSSKNGDLAQSKKVGPEADPEAAKLDSALQEQYGDKAQYYKDIPTTDEQKAIAHKKIEDAYYKLGQLYYQKLEEPDSAVESFETLLELYPESEYMLQSRYALYKLYREELRIQAYRAHMSFILDNHPNTVYAYLIQGKDPNELKVDEDDFYYAYNGLQQAYEKREFESSLGFGEYLMSLERFLDKDAIDMVKVQYIRGMSYGYLGQKDSLLNILTQLVKNHPDHGVTPLAQKTLGYLVKGIPEDTGLPEGGGSNGGGDASLKDPKNPIYKGFTTAVKSKEKVFVILYVDKKNVSKEELKTEISDFNNSEFSNNNLRTFVFLYKQTHWLPYIASFKSVEEAKRYLKSLKGKDNLEDLLTGKDRMMFMSHSNFKTAYGQKRMKDYMKYYEHILEEKW
ncbi:MAG: tetratricopeptide repeat protein [Bacteroidota bacterium]